MSGITIVRRKYQIYDYSQISSYRHILFHFHCRGLIPQSVITSSDNADCPLHMPGITIVSEIT